MTGPSTGSDLAIPTLNPPDLAVPVLTPAGQPGRTADIYSAPADDPLSGAAVVGGAGYLIRSEEHLQVSTVPVRARRVRLEKYVVTETRTITVQVSREEVRLVDVELGDHLTDEPTPAFAGGDAGDGGRWMTLSEERLAITTEVVPVERVRLGVYAVTEQHDVTDTVRREQVQLDTLPPGTDSDLHSHSDY